MNPADQCWKGHESNMTRSEFLKQVRDRRIDPDSFKLDGPKDECHVLEQRQACWVVYYSERGLESGRADFPTEAAALDDLLSRLRPNF